MVERDVSAFDVVLFISQNKIRNWCLHLANRVLKKVRICPFL